MTRIFSAKTSKVSISKDRSDKNDSIRYPGFTLLELIISMTMVSMVVLVLYYAFSIGVRTWDTRDDPAEGVIRLEAVIRLLEEDFRQIVPYSMLWEKGEISLFAGGPRSVFYVTKNGLGAASGAGAGLFFTSLYVDQCRDSSENCLFLIKKPYPSRDFVAEVDLFKGLGEFQKRSYVPGNAIAAEKILVMENITDARFSFSSQEYIPFGGINHELPEDRRVKEGLLEEDQWAREEVAHQIRFEFIAENSPWAVHSPVGTLGDWQ